tara:strand:- start:1514 stop:2830 length:1317 start_codon:yes stop_codon:yes gene_type:complete
MQISIFKDIFEHPDGLITLFFAEMWERFSYYGMRAILVLYLISDTNTRNPGLGWTNENAIELYGWYTALVYIACIPGGIIADRFISAKNAVILGGTLLCMGHLLMAISNIYFFYTSLTLIIIGVGFLKPSISSLVGSIYKENDVRRDQGFTIFYIGINFGAFFASLIVGYVGEIYGWHYGFSLAGFGMILGQIIFLRGRNNFKKKININTSKNLNAKKKFSTIQIDRIKLIILSSFILIVFWASFEQAGGLMNIFAFEKTNRNIDYLNFEVPASWFQSINPLLIILLGFYVSIFWVFLQRKEIISTSIFKIAVGIIIMGLGFVFMYFASIEAESFGKSSMRWLMLAYLFHTVGELCASPVILSYISKLSPKQLVSSIMGIYFAAIGLGNKLAGTIGQSSENFGEKQVFLGITLVCLVVGFTVILFHKKLIKLSHGLDK